MSSNKKSSFVLYHDIRGPLELLTDEQRGKLFMSILDYSEYGVVQDFHDGALNMAFAFIRSALDRDAEAWESKRAKRAEAGSLGGKQTQANRANATFATQNQQTEANQAVPVPVNAPVRESIEADKPPNRSRFVPPTVDEVKAYCLERKNGIDAALFVDFYATRGWTVGRGKMRDWKAAVRTWEKRRAPDVGETPPPLRRIGQLAMDENGEEVVKFGD